MTQRWMVAGALAAAALLGTACGATETSGSDPAASSSTTAAASTSGDGGCTPAEGAGLESILALVPDTAANREYTVVADLRAFLDDQGKELPDDFNDIEWANPVTLFRPTQLLQNAISQADTDEDPLADEYGIGLGDVDQSVSAGMAPEMTELLVGSFDPAAVEEVVGADPFWSEQQETIEAHGETFYSWGDDGEVQIEGRSPVRDLGIGGRLWVDDRVAAFTRATAPMEAFLAGCAGAEPTLADDEDYAGIAQHLADFDGAFNTTFTDQVSPDAAGARGGGGGARGTTPATDESEPLEGVSAYGFSSGPSDDPDEARIRLVLASGTEAEATANEERFLDRVEDGESATVAEPWSELLRVESSEVDGRFVIVELRADNTSVLDNALMRHDTLIVSEG